MQTKFDHFTDEQISATLRSGAFAHIGFEAADYVHHTNFGDLFRIALLARAMDYWKAWLGPPLTYHESQGLEFDGQHRCRAAKYLARKQKLQIPIPLRYSTRITEP